MGQVFILKLTAKMSNGLFPSKQNLSDTDFLKFKPENFFLPIYFFLTDFIVTM